jgi:hypothetical protein
MKIIEFVKKEKLAFLCSVLMIAFGIAEIVTGIRHEFFGLVTTQDTITKIIGISLGSCYLFAGIFLLVYTKWSLNIAFCLLVIDVIGRLIMSFSGMYPIDSIMSMQFVGMFFGTLIAVLFTIFVFIKRKKMK